MELLLASTFCVTFSIASLLPFVLFKYSLVTVHLRKIKQIILNSAMSNSFCITSLNYLYEPASESFVDFIKRVPGGTNKYLVSLYKIILPLCFQTTFGKEGTLSITQASLETWPSCTVKFSGDSLNA